MENSNKIEFGFSTEFRKIIEKLSKKDRAALKKIESHIPKIILNPIIGKPLRNVLKNYRRVHIDSFVLVYKIEGNKIIFIDYDHHDKVYKKTR